MSIFTFFFDFLTAGLYSQYFVVNAPLGFQAPASIAFSNIIDFHDYIIIFLVFVFLVVLWHIVWALNLSKILAHVLLIYAVVQAFYRFTRHQMWLFKHYNIVKNIVSKGLLEQSVFDKFVKVYGNKNTILSKMLTFVVNKGVFPFKDTSYTYLLHINMYFALLIAFVLFFLDKCSHIRSIPELLHSYLVFVKIDDGIQVKNQVTNLGQKKYIGFHDLTIKKHGVFDSIIESLILRVNYFRVLFKAKYITHAPDLEIFWTIFPSFILLAIAVPSLILLYQLDAVEPISLCVKVIGHQWYWTYEIGATVVLFSDLLPFRKIDGSTTFDSYMLSDDISSIRLLEVDNPLFVPAGVPLTFLITSTDVLHSWAVPSLGVKVDAIPGRLNQVGVNILDSGSFYGQCSELCGVNHGFMPINIHSYIQSSAFVL